MTSIARAPVWLGLDLRWAYGQLLPSIWRHTRCVHRAQDVLHDAFVRYAMGAAHASLAQPHAYLRTVVRSVLADHARDAARHVPLPEPDEAGDGHALADGAMACCAPSPEELADLQQRLVAVQRTIQGLPPRCREVFWLCRVEGCTQPEAAARLGISVNMAERHMIRALLDLRALRDLLAA